MLIIHIKNNNYIILVLYYYNITVSTAWDASTLTIEWDPMVMCKEKRILFYQHDLNKCGTKSKGLQLGQPNFSI